MDTEKRKAFGIFEGGGAKGLAHIGALKAAEEREIDFIGVGGTSAGSIVAALVAVGYTADELYNEHRPDSLFYLDFLSFFDKKQWQELEMIRNDSFKYLSGNRNLFSLWLATTFFLWRNRRRLKRLATDGGLLDTEIFEEWLNKKMVEKLKSTDPDFKPTGENGFVTFGDIHKPLKIIAADVESRGLKVFSMPQDKLCNIADAVGASIRIPFIFAPKSIDNDEGRYVDGGIVSNFPVWVVDEYREKAPLLTPTYGFRLIEENKSKKNTSDSFSLLAHTADVFKTAVFGDNTLETRKVSTLHEIPLRVRVGPLDLKLSRRQKNDLVSDGEKGANDYFKKEKYILKPHSYIKEILKMVDDILRRNLSHENHLRLNVMLPINNDTLKIVYTYNMDSEDDYDDRLIFKKGVGAAGHCWNIVDLVTCDLVDATINYENLWSMDKYQQRLVRKQLKSLLCVPIFARSHLQKESDKTTRKNAFIGVLNIDSDDDILDKLITLKKKENNVAIDCANLISTILTK